MSSDWGTKATAVRLAVFFAMGLVLALPFGLGLDLVILSAVWAAVSGGTVWWILGHSKVMKDARVARKDKTGIPNSVRHLLDVSSSTLVIAGAACLAMMAARLEVLAWLIMLGIFFPAMLATGMLYIECRELMRSAQP